MTFNPCKYFDECEERKKQYCIQKNVEDCTTYKKLAIQESQKVKQTLDQLFQEDMRDY